MPFPPVPFPPVPFPPVPFSPVPLLSASPAGPIRTRRRLIGWAVPVLAGLLAVPALASSAYAATTGRQAPPAAAGSGPAQLATGMMPADSPDAAPRTAAGLRGARACAVGSSPAAGAGQAQGVDVASYQHPGGAAINWGAAAAGGQQFAVVKATESTSYLNPYLQADVNSARAAGIYASAYHFARPAVDATAQADYFAAAFNSLGGTLLPPVLDLESNGGLDPIALIGWTNVFLLRLQADTGRVPMIYTGPSFWNNSMAGTTAFSQYPLWVAHYTTCSNPQQFGGWSSWTFWQFDDGSYFSTAPIAGIGMSVDRDRAFAGADDLAQLAVGPFQGTATKAQFPDGSFVAVAGTPQIYRVAGLSPIYVTSWASVGGVRPVKVVSAKVFSTLRAFPLDGTFIVGGPSGAVYRTVGGAAQYVTTWAPYGGVRPYTVIDDAAIANAGQPYGPYAQLRGTPSSGSFIADSQTGAVYRLAGGAPIYVSTWAAFGGVQTYTVVDGVDVANAGGTGLFSHLANKPSDGTFLVSAQSGRVYVVNGGTPTYVPSWAPYGGPQPATVVDQAALLYAGSPGVFSHLNPRVTNPVPTAPITSQPVQGISPIQH